MTRFAALRRPVVMSRAILEWSAALPALLLAAALAHPAFGARACMPVATVAIAGLCAWIVWQDLSTFTISNAAVVSLVLIAAALRFHEHDRTIAGMCVALGADIVLPGTFMLALREYFYRRRGYDGLGLGDVKLSVAGGALTGAVPFCWALCAASIISLLFVGLRMVWAQPLSDRDRIAFGAALAPAICAVWLGEQLSNLGPLLAPIWL